MNVGEPLLDIEAGTILVDTGEILSLAALHADGRSDGGKYCDDKIDDLLDGFFSHGLMIY